MSCLLQSGMVLAAHGAFNFAKHVTVEDDISGAAAAVFQDLEADLSACNN